MNSSVPYAMKEDDEEDRRRKTYDSTAWSPTSVVTKTDLFVVEPLQLPDAAKLKEVFSSLSISSSTKDPFTVTEESVSLESFLEELPAAIRQRKQLSIDAGSALDPISRLFE
jgi:hypothetical protein